MILNDFDSEMEVLSTVFDRVNIPHNIFELGVDDFDKPENKIIYKVMQVLNEKGMDITHLSVRNELQKRGHHKYIDNFVIDYHDSWVHTHALGNAEYAVERLKEMSKRRMIWYFSQKAVEHVQELSYPVEDIMLDTERGMQKVSQKNSVEYGTFQGFEQDGFVNETDYIPTGLKAIDDVAIGLFKGDLNVLAAKTYHGKSSLALDIAKYNCCRGSVLLFSLEMQRKKISQRLVCAAAELEFHQIVHGLNESQQKRFLAIQPTLKENLRNLKIYDKVRDFDKIVRECKRQAINDMPALIIIDYLQLIRCNQKPHDKRQNIGYMSNELKNIAMELNVPILLLSQFSRMEDYVEPKLYHLKEAGEIENDSDVVIFIHQDSSHNWWIIISKCRMGKRGKRRVDFEAKYFRFKDHIPEKIKYNDTLPYTRA